MNYTVIAKQTELKREKQALIHWLVAVGSFK